MRGSGMDGLAGVPYSRTIGKGRIVRPLLDYHRQELQDFLRKRDIQWIEDPSNTDTNFDRNYIRNKVFPELDHKWPGLVQRLNETANHARTSTQVMSMLVTEQYTDMISDPYILCLEPLLQMKPELQAIVLRQWLKYRSAVSPPRARLNEFLAQINSCANTNSKAELRWLDWQVKKQDEWLWLEKLPSPGECPVRAWSTTNELVLGHEFGKITLEGKSPVPLDCWMIGPRRAGAKMALKTGDPRRKLKDLMRLSGIPTWLRHSIPVLYWNDQLAAVGDWMLSAELKFFLSENSMTYKWLPSHPLLSKLQSVSVQRLGSTES
jgi:tRNA(Ile)-lysidine synthase